MKLFKVLLIISLLIFSHQKIDQFVEKETHKFTTRGISSRLEFNPAWETPQPSQEELAQLRTLLQQPFTYLNCGGQSFAFLSADGKYVLKFFKLFRRRLPDGLMYLPLPFFLERIREKKCAVKKAKLKRDFDSYMIAYNDLREESALLFLHLNKTNKSNRKLNLQVTVIDKIGIAHPIDLDEKEFLIQKKVTLAYETIDQLMQQGDIDSAKKRIESILQLTLLRYQKGIYDDDAFIAKNYGFDGDKPILLDIGRFQKKPEYAQPEVYRKDFELIVGRLRSWLEQKHPTLLPHLDKKMQEVVCQ